MLAFQYFIKLTGPLLALLGTQRRLKFIGCNVGSCPLAFPQFFCKVFFKVSPSFYGLLSKYERICPLASHILQKRIPIFK